MPGSTLICASFLDTIEDTASFSELNPEVAPVHYYDWSPDGGDFETYRNGSSITYKLPESLRQFQEAIAKVAQHEHSAYPYELCYFIGITIRQSHIAVGREQIQEDHKRLVQPAHRDRTGHFGPEWLHLYVVSDNSPTEFFPTHEADSRDEVTVSEAMLADQVVPRPYQIAYANRMTYHRSPKFQEAGQRTFLRLQYHHDLPASL